MIDVYNMIIIIVFLFLLQLKHLIVDFYLQTPEMVKGKGIFGNVDGIFHSLQHAVGTLLAFNIAFLFSPISYPVMIVTFIVLFDFVTHYLIDWTKMNYGNRDITNEKFWQHLGLDQFAHQVVYLLIVLFIAYFVV